MEKQDPEGKNVPSRVEQLRHLRKWVRKNNAFRFCRGSLGGNIFTDTVGSANSPTQFCLTWDELSSDIRIVGNQLKVYQRDGWEFAYKELLAALTSRTHKMWNEKLPYVLVHHCTLIIPDPEKTFTLIDWMLNVPQEEIDMYMERKTSDLHPSGLTGKLFGVLPSLENFLMESPNLLRGWSIDLAYKKDVIGDFHKFPDFLNSPPAAFPVGLANGQWDERIQGAEQIVLGYFLAGDIKDVMKNFCRKDQKRLAAWTFNLPKWQYLRVRDVGIGLHVKSEHGIWAPMDPELASINVSHGYGAIINPEGIDPENLQEYQTKFQGCRFGKSEEMASRFMLFARYEY